MNTLCVCNCIQHLYSYGHIWGKQNPFLFIRNSRISRELILLPQVSRECTDLSVLDPHGMRYKKRDNL